MDGEKKGRVARSAAPPRVLPDAVYDTLHFSALVYGGVGRRSYNDYISPDEGGFATAIAPRCALGHAMWVDPMNEVYIAVRVAGITEGTNDDAFAPGEDRIPFEEWCRRLNVIPAREAR